MLRVCLLARHIGGFKENSREGLTDFLDFILTK